MMTLVLPTSSWIQAIARRCTLLRISAGGPHGDSMVAARAPAFGRRLTRERLGREFKAAAFRKECSDVSELMSRVRTQMFCTHRSKLARPQALAAKNKLSPVLA